MAVASNTVPQDPELAIARRTQELLQSPTAEHWNNWAVVQAQCGRNEEALAGLTCALELDAANPVFMGNRACVAVELRRWREAADWAAEALQHLPPGTGPERARLEELRDLAAGQLPPWTHEQAECCLLAFCGDDANARDYFATHQRRYLATLDMVPTAAPRAKLLELGAAFHHLTPALRRLAGYRDIRCSDVWHGDAIAEHVVRASDGQVERFQVDNFDAEHGPWPHADASYDLVLCCEMLEHLALDPMAMLGEINRVLRPGGHLLLTTPNLASAKAFAWLARGESPYCWSQFEPHGIPTDRHNREYTTSEVVRLLECAGLAPVQVKTETFYWRQPPSVFAQIAALGYPLARRGDTTMVLAQKAGPVKDRYPEEFYQSRGTQQQRRDLDR